jgi:sensor histidine kinase YesM
MIMMCSYLPHLRFSYKLLLKVLKQTTHISCRRSKGVAKCDECAKLKQSIKSAVTMEMRNIYKVQLKYHQKQSRLCKEALWHHNAKAQ